jgi:hypothetical protein
MGRHTGSATIDWTPEREAALIHQRNSGQTLKQVAAFLGLEYEAVKGHYRRLQAAGVRFVCVPRPVRCTPEVLRQIQVLRDQKKSSRQIGKVLGCPSATVRKWWSRAAPAPKAAPKHIPDLIALYTARELTIEEIAAKLKISPGKTYREVKKLIAAGRLTPRKPISKGCPKEIPAVRLGDDARFALAMNGRRFEDAPHEEKPIVRIPRPTAPNSFVGCAAEMCVGA